jgi:hypothetical protein
LTRPCELRHLWRWEKKSIELPSLVVVVVAAAAVVVAVKYWIAVALLVKKHFNLVFQDLGLLEYVLKVYVVLGPGLYLPRLALFEAEYLVFTLLAFQA